MNGTVYLALKRQAIQISPFQGEGFRGFRSGASPHQAPAPRSRTGGRLDRHAHRGEAFEELLRLLGLDVLEPPRKIVRARFPDLGQEIARGDHAGGQPFRPGRLAAFLPFAALAGTAVSSPASMNETWVAALVPCGF